MIAFFLVPAFLLAIPFIENPWWQLACLLPVIPAVYAMWTGAPSVPTPAATMKRMFDLAKISKDERVYDLGCGDGRFVFRASKMGARAVGFELSPLVYLFAKCRSFFHGGTILCRDFWKQDLSDADVVFCYLLMDSMQTFKTKLWPTLKPGTRVVSHAFSMEGIEPAGKDGNVRLYIKE